MVLAKTKNQIKRKQGAVDALIAYNGHVTKKVFKKNAKLFNTSVAQLQRAYMNFLNFGKIDLRVKRASKAVAYSWTKTTLKNCNKVHHLKKRNVTSKEAGNILAEYCFTWKGRTTDFLIKNKISFGQFYSWIRELNIYGTLLGRRIFNFNKYGKLNFLKAVKIYKNRKRSPSYFKSVSWAKGLTDVERKMYRSYLKTLTLYL